MKLYSALLLVVVATGCQRQSCFEVPGDPGIQQTDWLVDGGQMCAWVYRSQAGVWRADHMEFPLLGSRYFRTEDDAKRYVRTNWRRVTGK